MSKKIVAMGGGTIGEMSSNGVRQPYETANMDNEIIKLSDSPKPNILFIGFADIPYSSEYFNLIDEVYSRRYNCHCKHLSIEDIVNLETVNDYFDWADVFYVGGGNTYTLMHIIRNYGLDDKLRDAYNQGKVMCGNSAGGICWFSYGNSVIPTDQNKNLIKLKCLGFRNMVFAPHCDEINGHFENIENLLLGENMVGISLSNASAIEIIDDKYRIITADTDRYKINPFALKSFWFNDKYYIENIEINNELSDFKKLMERMPSGKQTPEEVKCLLKRRNIYFNK